MKITKSKKPAVTPAPALAPVAKGKKAPKVTATAAATPPPTKTGGRKSPAASPGGDSLRSIAENCAFKRNVRVVGRNIIHVASEMRRDSFHYYQQIHSGALDIAGSSPASRNARSACGKPLAAERDFFCVWSQQEIDSLAVRDTRHNTLLICRELDTNGKLTGKTKTLSLNVQILGKRQQAEHAAENLPPLPFKSQYIIILPNTVYTAPDVMDTKKMKK